jgi:hypothetical protein
MDFEMVPKTLIETLKRMLPHKKNVLRKGPLVTLRAEGDAVDLIGEFENTWSLPASVRRDGDCTVDLVTLMTKLKTYDQKTPLRFVLGEDGLRFGTTKMTLHERR